MINLKFTQTEGQNVCEVTVDAGGKRCPSCEAPLVPGVQHRCVKETSYGSLEAALRALAMR